MIKIPRVIFALLLCWSSYTLGQATKDSIVFHPIGGKAFQGSSTQIYQDSNGFMWIGTTNGIYKYDGGNFKLFDATIDGKVGLTDGYIKCFIEDDKQNLIIGTLFGLNIYDRKLDVVKPYTFKETAQFLQSKYINALFQKEEQLWIGTFRNGLYRLNTETGNITKITLPNPKKSVDVGIYGIHEHQNSNKYIVVASGAVYSVNKDKGDLVFETNEYIQKSFLTPDGNTLVLGTRSGKLLLLDLHANRNLNAKEVAITPNHTILSLATDRYGNIWCGTENKGVVIYHPKTGTTSRYINDLTKPYALQGNSIWSLYYTKDNTMWLGIFKNGLSVYDSNYFKFEHVKANPFKQDLLNNNKINCFYEDQTGNVYIGTDGGGLNYWDRQTNTYTHYNLDNNNFYTNVVLSILPDGHGNLLIGSWANGLGIFNLETKKFRVLTKENSFLDSNHIFDMTKDKKGRIWIPTFYGGLHWYNPVTNASGTIPLKSNKGIGDANSISRVLTATDGTIWVGTQNTGLYKIIEAEDGNWIIKQFQKGGDNSLTNDFINSIYQDRDSTIWVGTESGLNTYNAKDDIFTPINIENTLKGSPVRAIIQDADGYFWLSTDKELLQYNNTTKEIFRYTITDGLQANEFNRSAVYKTSNGQLLFGGSDGFNLFFPSEIKKSTKQPPLYISKLKIFNQLVTPNDDFAVLEKDISQTDSLKLSYKHNVIDFEFNAITYKNAAKVKYAYYLEGFENEWNYVENRNTATYTNLNPGTYTLHIKSSNADGIWVENAVSVFIKITPPFWETWWFRISITLVLIGLAYAFYLQRTRRIKAYQRRLKKEIKARTFELEQQQHKLIETANQLSERNEEIKRFTYALSHDLKSPLGNITLLTRFIADDLGDKKSKDTEKYLEFIDEACTTLQTLIADITEIAKLGHIKNKNEAVDTRQIAQKAIAMMVSRVQEQDVKILIAENMPVLVGDANRFFQVFENLLDNAVKYMGDQKNPSITIESHTTVDEIKITITDNGSGMDKNALNKLFTPFERFNSSTKGTGLGLFMTKKVVESHEGTLTASSAGKGKGSTFELSFPLSRLHCA
ncbi:ligand-binding sensor domain-containing protein [Croceivirga radicis]|nr:sensor histidine kinase [Croceivirga radicis]